MSNLQYDELLCLRFLLLLLLLRFLHCFGMLLLGGGLQPPATKHGTPASDYITKVKSLTDSLAALGSPLTTDEHIEVLLEGLNSLPINQNTELFSLCEVETMIMSHDEAINKNRTQNLNPAQANLTQSSFPSLAEEMVDEEAIMEEDLSIKHQSRNAKYVENLVILHGIAIADSMDQIRFRLAMV
ncbi:hypothetical protein PIB30_014852 [Stylosanthes scabra]|uniref:Uncharacterized protein n=1 Tax=Stylosanthes scabra TaxID=79078 RepID=A0ABU6S676_9FABA|nr:hypothetical protein [Stylosanthes scabra]